MKIKLLRFDKDNKAIAHEKLFLAHLLFVKYKYIDFTKKKFITFCSILLDNIHKSCILSCSIFFL
jgi:hypothetical protein